MKRILVLVCIGFLSIANAADRLPILDMHMHAYAADAQGPPPLAMCTPMMSPIWDQTSPYGAVFMDMVKRPTCDDPIWSPETDEELLSQTLDVI